MAEKNPPKWALYILKSWLSDDLEEEIGGDLLEAFYWRAEKKSAVFANWMFVWEVIKTLTIRNRKEPRNKSFMLLINYLKIAWRFHKRTAPYTLLNIACLSTGIVVFILCYLYIKHEKAFDRTVPHSDKIQRVVYAKSDLTGYKGNARAAYPLGPAMKEDFSEVDEFLRIYQITTGGAQVPIIENKTEKYFEPQFFTADPQVFDFLGIEFLQGDPKSAFNEPNSLVITASKARKYFGNANPIGEFLTFHFYDTAYSMKVTGVMKSFKNHSHTDIEILAPMKFKEQSIFPGWTGWDASIAYTYIRLVSEESAESIKEALPGFIKRNYPEKVLKMFGDFNLDIQPLQSIHLNSHLRNEMEANGDVKTINWIWVIASLSLIMSIINFINLSTAWAHQRAKEVSMRKVLGGNRSDVIKQFVLEAIMMTFISLCVSVLVIYFVLPTYQELISIRFDPHDLVSLSTLITAIAFAIVVGIIAGLYPSFVISFFQPKSFNSKSGDTGGRKGESVRSVLVISQFAISIVFLIVMINMRDQLHLIQKGDIGIHKDQLILVKGSNSLPLVNELNQLPSIAKATTAGGDLPGVRTQGKWKVHPEGKYAKSGYRPSTIYAGANICSTLGGEILQGRDFNQDDVDHSVKKFLINESAAKAFGWETEDAIGKYVGWSIWKSDSIAAGKVVGVFKDFHHESFHQSINPLIMIASSHGDIMVKINTVDLQALITDIEDVWIENNSDLPFDVEFMDERIDKLYQSEQLAGSLTSNLTIIALLISGFGLLSLASYLSKSKMREVSIRKVFGASSTQILLFFYRRIVLLLAISSAIALPVGITLANRWLNEFAVRTSIDVGQFVVIGLIIVLLTFISVAWQTFKVSFSNPTNTLRHE